MSRNSCAAANPQRILSEGIGCSGSSPTMINPFALDKEESSGMKRQTSDKLAKVRLQLHIFSVCLGVTSF
jgi:hypothetical protein